MKKPKAVIDAEKIAAEKAIQLAAAKGDVCQLEREYSNAVAAIRKAQEDADASLPQCSLVRSSWRSSAEVVDGKVVVVRRTPSGMLVVRRVGDSTGCEYKFKWDRNAEQYRQAEKRFSSVSDTRALRDVPNEYAHNLQEV